MLIIDFLGLTSIFYIAYLVAEAPGNYILQKANINYTVSICMFIWGKTVEEPISCSHMLITVHINRYTSIMYCFCEGFYGSHGTEVPSRSCWYEESP